MEKTHNVSASQSYAPEYIKFFMLLGAIFLVSYVLSVLYPHNTSFAMTYMLHTMGVFFIVFSLFQFAGYTTFVHMFSDYDPIAKRFSMYAYAYPAIGIALGVLYLFNLLAPWRDVFTAAIMLIGAYGVWKTVQRNKTQVHCACLGNIIKLPLSTVTLTEDVAMGLMALLMSVLYFI